MTISFSRLVLSIGLLFLALGSLHAAGERPALPSHETLARLLGEEARVRAADITIAVVVRGEADLSRKFKTKDAIHVTFIWPVPENGRRVRAIETRVFLWNEQYGWFIYFDGERRGLPVINVCSEKLGMIEIK